MNRWLCIEMTEEPDDWNGDTPMAVIPLSSSLLSVLSEVAETLRGNRYMSCAMIEREFFKEVYFINGLGEFNDAEWKIRIAQPATAEECGGEYTQIIRDSVWVYGDGDILLYGHHYLYGEFTHDPINLFDLAIKYIGTMNTVSVHG